MAVKKLSRIGGGLLLAATGMLVLLLSASPSRGYIERMYTFQEALNETQNILVGKITKVDTKGKIAMATVERAIRGPVTYKNIIINVGGGPNTHADFMMDRLATGQEFVFWYSGGAGEIYTGDTWFQLYVGDVSNPEKAWWRLNHVEIRFNRTFNGTTADLIKLTEDVIAKRVQPPPANPNVPPLDVDRPSARVVMAGGGKAGGLHRQFHLSHQGGFEIRGLCWADVNGDGLLDLLACRQNGNVLLVNQGGNGVLDLTQKFGLAGGSRSAGWADWDGQGQPGLATANFQLYANAFGALRDDSRLLPLPGERAVEGAGWIDYNADGLPDLLVANGPYGMRLLENSASGRQRFRDVSDRAGLGPRGAGVGNGDYFVCFDYDNDGYPDIFYNLGKGVLLHNQGDGSFRAVHDCGIELDGNTDAAHYKRGLAVGDFDNDGFLDVFVPGPGRPKLYHNNHDGTFTDVLENAGDLAGVVEPSFSAAWGDVNGDGFLDLVVCFPDAAPKCFLGDGKGHFTNVSEAVGLSNLPPAMTASFGDLNNDGKQDLALNCYGKLVLAINQIETPKSRGLVSVSLKVRKGAVGAVARAYDRRGKLLGMRHLGACDGAGGQTCPQTSFALPIDECIISVCLSDGRVAQKCYPVQKLHTMLVFRDEEFQ